MCMYIRIAYVAVVEKAFMVVMLCNGFAKFCESNCAALIFLKYYK